LAKEDAVRNDLIETGVNVENLDFFVANLTSDDGWDAAVEGCDYVQHVASPFPLEQPRHKEALVPEALGGTMRVLNAALKANVKRVVLTSSIAAMMYRAGRPKTEFHFSENDWTDPAWAGTHPYSVSKTRAELAAWEWAEKAGREKLVAINPGVVVGPTMGKNGSTSTEIIKMMLEGAMPKTLPIANPLVDVRDLAELHVVAMELEEAGGRRLIGTSGTLSFAQIAKLLSEEYPHLKGKIPQSDFSPFLVSLLKLFMPSVRTIRAEVGIRSIADADYVSELTGVSFRPVEDAVLATARSILGRDGKGLEA
jgi:nucleoside-diphosphate-sugar epimerase